ncbi:MAG: hypothetical protein KKB34_11885 [Bacteroidetes bacterium]|nr:hypothetical protein [Bacteroidota bacterium]
MLKEFFNIKRDVRTFSFIFAFITSFACFFFPLLNSLSYEYSAFNSILLGYLSGLIIIEGLLKGDGSRIDKFTFLMLGLVGAVPFVISFFGTLFFQVCPVWQGALFYLIITIPAIFIGAVLGYFSFIAAKKFRKLIFSFVYLVLLLTPLAEIYFRPQVYLHHSIFTFFPGTIYDESIPIDLKMIQFRLYSMLPFVITLIGANYIKKTNNIFNNKIIIPIFIISFGLYFYLKPSLGFSTTEEVLKKNLIGEVVTDHFIINYPQSLSVSELNHLILLHEYYFFKITEQTGINYSEKINSFIFKDNIQKRKLFGAGNADVAKPWLGQTYTSLDNYENSLKHELVHIFTAKIGSTFLKLADNWNPAVIEGYAMAIENDYNGYDIDYLAAIARESGYTIPFSQLFSGFNFLGGTSSISYIYSGSFIKYLLGKYGISKLNSFYSDSDFQNVYDNSIENLESSYYSYLDSLNYEVKRSTAQLFFGTLPLVKKICPRISANQIDDAWKSFSEGDYIEAKKLFDKNYNYSGAYSSLVGKLRSRIKLGEISDAFTIAKYEIKKFEKSAYKYSLLIEFGDLAGLNADYDYADSLYSDVSTNLPNEYYVCIAETRKLLMKKYPNDYLLYIKGNQNERFYILTKIHNNEHSAYFIPLILNLSNELKISHQIVNIQLDDILINDKYIGSYIYNLLSNYYLIQGFYQKAIGFSNLSSKLSKPERSNTNSENLKKIVWINNYADKILRGKKIKDFSVAK